MRIENLVAYLDGEGSPGEQEEIERGLTSDPAAFALFRRLCRQRVMLAQALNSGLDRVGKEAGPAARRRFRIPWQLAAATLLFAVTLASLRLRKEPEAPADPQVVRGVAFAAGRAVRRIPRGVPVEASAESTAAIRLKDGSELDLHPLGRVVFQGSAEGIRETTDLARGTATFRVREGAEEFHVRTGAGILSVRGAEFTLELVPDTDPRGRPMESLMVRVRAGGVRMDVAGRTHALAAGEARAFRADGAVADTLPGLKNREGERRSPEK